MDGNHLYTISASLFLHRRVLKLLDPNGNIAASAKKNRPSEGLAGTIAGTSFRLESGDREDKAERKRDGMIFASPFNFVADTGKGRCFVGRDGRELIAETMGYIHKQKETHLYLSTAVDEPLALLMLVLLPTQREGAFSQTCDRDCGRAREHMSEGNDGLF